MVRIDDKGIAVGQTLLHASEGSNERGRIFVAVRPGNALRLRVILQDARLLSRSEIIVQKKMSIVQKFRVVLGSPNPLSRPGHAARVPVQDGNGVEVAHGEEHL